MKRSELTTSESAGAAITGALCLSRVITISVALAATLLPIAASAQTQDTSTAVVTTQKRSWNYQNAPIQEVLKGFFKSMNANYIIDQDVAGTVNISLNDISTDVALRAIMRSANPPLTYDIENGIYHVKVKHVQVVTTDETLGTAPRTLAPTLNKYHLDINYYDVTVIAQLLAAGGGIITVPVNAASGGGGGTGGVTTVSPSVSGGGNIGGGGGGFGQGGFGR